MPKAINSSIPEEYIAPSSIKLFSPINTNDLPRPFNHIPSNCRTLPDVAKYEIESLQAQEEQLHHFTTKRRNNNTKNTTSQGIHNQTQASQKQTNMGHEYSTNEIQNAIDDGFLLCDLNVIRLKLMAWKQMFPRIKPFFAIKCNPDPMVSHILGRTYYQNDKNNNEHEVCGFDCASLAEIQLALQSSHCEHIKRVNEQKINNIGTATTLRNNNTTSKSIVYANPQRAIFDLENALKLGVNALTFDSAEELQKVKSAFDRLISATKQANECDENEDNNGGNIQLEPPDMILRILVPDTHSTVPLGEKFGVNPFHVQNLTRKALELNLNVIGVSFHCGSGNHDPESYKEAILIAKSCIDDINVVLREFDKQECYLLDIGGGYPGYDGVGADFNRFASGNQRENSISNEMNGSYDPSTETAYKIAQVVSPLVDELFPKTSEMKIDIISEPGRYFVEAAFAYCAKIYSVKCMKQNGDSGDVQYHYYIAQGVQGLFKDVILCNELFTPLPLSMSGDDINDYQGERNVFPSTVHGPSGESFDIVSSNCLLPKLTVGDWLLFDRMGAYTMSIAARNRNLSVRYVC